MFNIKVPETILCFLIVQTCSAVWWASSQTTKTEQIKSDVSEIKTGFYTRAEAVLSFQNVENKQSESDRRVTRLEEQASRASSPSRVPIDALARELKLNR